MEQTPIFESVERDLDIAIEQLLTGTVDLEADGAGEADEAAH